MSKIPNVKKAPIKGLFLRQNVAGVRSNHPASRVCLESKRRELGAANLQVRVESLRGRRARAPLSLADSSKIDAGTGWGIALTALPSAYGRKQQFATGSYWPIATRREEPQSTHSGL